MQNLYENNSANSPRLKTDRFFVNYDNKYVYNGFMNEAFNFVEKAQLLSPSLWRRFVAQFKSDADSADCGWRGEYWGKMMRGACFVYSYTRSEELYATLAETVSDMLSCADENGRISSYSTEREFNGWDIWCRKYVLLGMQYFLEICKNDELRARIISSMCGQVDYLISKLGAPEEGKRHICKTSTHWRGLNSSSVLEPVVRLYSITGEKRYFDFAKYIVDIGGTDVENIFHLAYENGLAPYQYPVTKAYEMTSCFEGLLEFYRVTGVEWYKTAVLNFADRVLEGNFTVIGSAGCTHELFDHSTVRQANTTNNEVMQETCVTVTLMKFFYQLNVLTGEARYADAFETSLYNAYLGALNTNCNVEGLILEKYPDAIPEALPFDSYSPLTAGARGTLIGGFKVMSDKHYYGCCACIGSAGIGLVPKLHFLTTERGFALNFFIDGSVETQTANGQRIRFTTKTDYPRTGRVSLVVSLAMPESFELLVRNPEWSTETEIDVNGESVTATEGYVAIDRLWRDGDRVELTFDMTTKAILPIHYGSQVLMNKCADNYVLPTYDVEDPIAHRHVALRRGPVMLAQDNSLGYDLNEPIDVLIEADGSVKAELPEGEDIAPYSHVVELNVPLTNGKKMTVTDYASAGKLWGDNQIAVWMLTV